jgi:polyferredoxin
MRKLSTSIIVDLSLALIIALGALHIGYAFSKAFNGWNSPLGAVAVVVGGER